jgi:N-acyl-D-aspartate/D-glutamate deacylase
MVAVFAGGERMDGETTMIRGGTVFDGAGGPGVVADVLLRTGRVEAIGPALAAPADARVVDATGAWVTPGFIDLHTHYDAELELAPGLVESVRHGVTTVLVGSCGLSLAVGTPPDLADMFCRVEGVPRSTVLPLLERVLDWRDPAGYLEHLERLPLGPHVVSLLGHSAVRAHVMGLGRSVDAGARPTEDELRAMERILEGALDAGYLGLSINTLPWDKMDGERFRSRPTPSVFAGWREYRRLARVLRRRGAVFQGVPDLSTGINLLLFLAASAGLGRRPLKTMVIALVDSKATRGIHRVAGGLVELTNRFLNARFRFQALPNPFDLWVDGLEVPVIEEFAAGTVALHEADPARRAALLRDPAYRRRFARDWGARFLGRAYHRDLFEATIVDCPDRSLVGRSFGAIAQERGEAPLATFLDLQAEYGAALRWYTVVGNDRAEQLEWILTRPSILVGFSDAGAHLRNMGYYNFPLRLLRRVRDAEAAGRPFMTVGRAVERLTAEIADYLAIDAGRLAPGRRADVTIVDPAGLTEAVEQIAEADMPGFPGLRRLVRRNDAAVRAVFVGGRLAWDGTTAPEAFGRDRGYGTVLRARLAD